MESAYKQYGRVTVDDVDTTIRHLKKLSEDHEIPLDQVIAIATLPEKARTNDIAIATKPE